MQQDDNASYVDVETQRQLLAIADHENLLRLLISLTESLAYTPALLFEDFLQERLDLIAHDAPGLYKGYFLPEVRRVMRGVRVSEEAFTRRVNGQHKNAQTQTVFQGQTLETLLTTYYPEPQWAVHGLIPEGCLILAGKPKHGKSYLALTLALAVAKQQTCLDHFPVTAGDVLCFSLEDYAKRVQKRMQRLYTTTSTGHTIEFIYNAPKMSEGFGERLKTTLLQRPSIRLVIIDTLRCIRDAQTEQYNLYQEDSDFIGGLNQCAQDAGTTILIIHHTRKAKSDDVFEEISGTGGLRGSTSANMVLEETKGEADGLLKIEGKDFEQRLNVALKRKEDGSWTYIGEGEIYQLRANKRAIIQAIQTLGDDATGKEVWQCSGIQSFGTVRSMLSRMAALGELGKSQKGVYFLIDVDEYGIEV